MAYGLPVIATKVGARGYPTAIVADTEVELLHALRKLNDPKLKQLDWRKESEKNLAYAKTISWDVVGEAFRQVVTGDVTSDVTGDIPSYVGQDRQG